MSTQGLTFTELIGYDPWEFPKFVNPMREFCFVLFGWGYTEAVECICILFGARKKWRSHIHIGLSIAIVCQVVSTTMTAIAVGTEVQVSDDLFIGPKEFANSVVLLITQLVGRWGYFYAAFSITLGVFRSNQLVRWMLYLVTALGVAGNMAFVITMFYNNKVCYNQWVIYNETKDAVGALYNTLTDILPIIAKDYGPASLAESSTAFIFIVLTKFIFLAKIYNSLNVGLRDALCSIASHRSSQRLVSCVIVATIEAAVNFDGITTFGYVVAVCNKMFQINSLAILAFEGAVTLVQEHSMGSHMSSQTPSRTASISKQGATAKQSVVRSEKV